MLKKFSEKRGDLMILVISNMYPSKKYPNYGVFVKNFYEKLSLAEKAKIIYITKTTN